LHLRSMNRINFTRKLSHFVLTPQIEIHGSIGPVYLFLSGGIYKRWVSLSKKNAFPLFQATDFSDWDFATQFGILTTFSSQWMWLNRVSTFDEVDTFNLNNPFVESALLFRKSRSAWVWGLTSRYQLTLGFGRLDRLMFGLLISFDF